MKEEKVTLVLNLNKKIADGFCAACDAHNVNYETAIEATLFGIAIGVIDFKEKDMINSIIDKID
jgi:hypothetical protein